MELVKRGWWGQAISSGTGNSDIAKLRLPVELARTTTRARGLGRLWEWGCVTSGPRGRAQKLGDVPRTLDPHVEKFVNFTCTAQ